MKAVDIRTEYLKDPIGIGVKEPRVFWKCEGGLRQTAYRVLSDKWDSGKVESSSMRAVCPLPLASGERVEFRIKLWDENGGEGDWSEPAFFEMGLLEKSDWEAKWITGNYRVNKLRRYPVDCFRKEFESRGAVASARLYVTACGLCRVAVNGERVSMPLAPGITDYRKRVQYQTHDVTSLIKEKNVITAELADGWYRGGVGSWGLRNQYGKETKLLAQLEIRYENGEKMTVVTDGGWSWSDDGPIRFADNKDGERVDANMAPSYSGRAKVTSHAVTPTASDNVPTAEKETFTGALSVSPSGKKIIDFGVNIAGCVSFRVNAKKGQKIRMRFGEMLKDGELYQKNVQLRFLTKTSPLQRIDYVCRDGVNEYKTAFSIFGFRYAEIDTDVDFTAADFTAVAVYSDLEETGRFESSNELLDRFVEATRRSARSNSADLPTDCPTRERHGWLGDAQIFVNTASYLFNCLPFARKFERDVLDAQRANGCFTQIAPTGGVDFYMRGMDGSAGWSDTGVLIPYRLWKNYGDERMLTEFYESMKRFAEYKIKTLGRPYPTALPTGIKRGYGKFISNYGRSYGEWAEPADVRGFTVTDFLCPHPEETTAYIAYTLSVMAEIAAFLGKEEDEKRFSLYAEKAKTGYRELTRAKRHSLDTDRQAKLVRPLALGLLDEEGTAYAEKRLVKALDRYGRRLGTGFLCTPLILDVLAKIDVELAYSLLENEERPGWLSMPKAGANTVWEAWEGPDSTAGGIGSLNHYSKGAVVEWLFGSMCGIRVAGENRFTVAPIPGGSFTRAKAEYDSVYGTVKSGWEKDGNGYKYDIEIPPNCEADLIIDGKKETVGPGRHVRRSE